MKKKILTKHILMALAMAAMVPAGQAWAKDIDPDWNPTVDPTTNTLTITPTGTVTSSANYTYGGKPISEYSNIVINYVAKTLGTGLLVSIVSALIGERQM